ncbi:MAG: CoA protein activase [Heliobacteriaceae bacterium]|nr:CoA protein activase [Heliobacteriaceae bacterium]
MNITFPRMGNSYNAFAHFINRLGHKAVVPPPLSDRTLSLGVKHAPEFACIPFKIILGSYLEAIEQGADIIITSGGSGPCRAGFYGILHERILRSLGYDIEVVVFDSIYQRPKDFFAKANRFRRAAGVSWPRFFYLIWEAWEMVKALDELERLSLDVRPREKSVGATTRALDQAYEIMAQAETNVDIQAARDKGLALLRGVPLQNKEYLLKIGIVGEIYVLIEPFANLNIQEMLGNLGVFCDRAIYLSGWTKENTVADHDAALRRTASPYVNQMIGGHGLENVAYAIRYQQQGFDGVVHLAPFACIPEIVVKSVFPRVTHELDFPVLDVFLDELTGKAGLQTRLEAFVDMLAFKRGKYQLGGVYT